MAARVYYYAESTGRTTSTTTDYSTVKISLPFTPNANKTYAIIWSIILDGNNTSWNQKVRIQNTTESSTLDEENMYVRGTTVATSNTSAGGVTLYTAGASPAEQTIEMQVASENSALTLGAQEATLLILELIDSVDIWGSSTGSSSTSSSTYSSKLTLSWTPATAGDYFVLMSLEQDAGGGSGAAQHRININSGTIVSDMPYPDYGSGEWSMYAGAARLVNISGANTAALQYASGNATQISVRNAFGVALRLDQFPAAFWAEDRTLHNSTTGSFVDAASVTATPAAFDHAIVATGIISTTASGYGTSTANKLAAGGTGLATISSHMSAYTGGWRCWFQLKKRTESASSTTWSTQYARSVGSATAKSDEHVLAVLQIDDTPAASEAAKRSSILAYSGGDSAISYRLDDVSGLDAYDRAHITGLYRNLNYSGMQQRSSTVSLDVAVLDTISASVTADAAVEKRFSATASCDSVVEKSISATVSPEAAAEKQITAVSQFASVVQATRSLAASLDGSASLNNRTATTSFDANVELANRTATASLDAAAAIVHVTSVSGDAVVEKSITATAGIEAAVQKQITATVQPEGAVQSTLSATANLDGNVAAAGTSHDASLDTAVAKVFSAATTADLVAEKAFSATTGIDSAVAKAFSVSAGAESAVEKAITASSAADGAAQVVDKTAQSSLDAITEKTVIASADVTGAVQKTLTVSASLDVVAGSAAGTDVLIGVDAAILDTIEASASLDLAVAPPNTLAIASADVVAQAAKAVSVDAEAAVQTTALAVTGIDATTQSVLTAATSFDAAAQSTRTAVSSVDVSAQVPGTILASSDAIVEKTFSASISAETASQTTRLASVDLDANLIAQDVRQVVANVEGAVEKPLALTASLDGIASLVSSVSTGLDAQIFATGTVVAQADISVWQLKHIAPEAILASTNVTGTVEDIDEYPEAPDTNWLTATTLAATAVRVSFGTPSSPPDGEQNFQCYVRRTAGTINPAVNVELWQAGSIVKVVGESLPVTSTTGQFIETEWNSSDLVGTLDGSDVELRLSGIVGQNPDTPGALPAYFSVGTASTSATLPGARDIVVPSHASGDLLLLQVLCRNTENNGALATINTAGWTQAGGVGNMYGGAQNARLGFGWKIGDGSESVVNVTATGGTTSDRFLGRVYVFKATDGFANLPVQDIGPATTGSGTTVTMPTVAPGGTTANKRAVALLAASSSTTVGDATGEANGNWTAPVLESQQTLGTIDIQTSDQSSGATISGGSATLGTTGAWVGIGFTLVPATIPGTVDTTVEFGALEWNSTYGVETATRTNLEAAVLATRTVVTTAESAIAARQEVATALEAAVAAARTAQTLADSVASRVISQDASLDAIAVLSNSAVTAAEAAVQKTVALAYQLDVAAQVTGTLSASLDPGSVAAVQALSAALDAIAELRGAISALGDVAVEQAAIAATTAADIAVAVQNVATSVADAIAYIELTCTSSFDGAAQQNDCFFETSLDTTVFNFNPFLLPPTGDYSIPIAAENRRFAIPSELRGLSIVPEDRIVRYNNYVGRH